jgi:hypothetical protein
VDGKGRGEPDQHPPFERDLAVPLDLPGDLFQRASK